MVSEHYPAASRLFAENAQSHLLKLPPELRNRIYESALTADSSSRNRELHTPHRPALLQVCRQLRDETRLFYFSLNRFHIIVTVNNTKEVRRWAAAITDEELRSIPSLTFQLRTKYGRLTLAMVYRYGNPEAFVRHHTDADERADNSTPSTPSTT
jgi:hypothetical protein